MTLCCWSRSCHRCRCGSCRRCCPSRCCSSRNCCRRCPCANYRSCRRSRRSRRLVRAFRGLWGMSVAIRTMAPERAGGAYPSVLGWSFQMPSRLSPSACQRWSLRCLALAGGDMRSLLTILGVVIIPVGAALVAVASAGGLHVL